MDEFEKEYFSQLENHVINYQGHRKELANSRIKLFTAAVSRQLIDEKEKFDLIVGAGNSCLFMMEITKMVYKTLKINLPPTLTIPLYRFKKVDGKTTINDNSVLNEYISNKINSNISNLNVLFIDDEVMTGLTVKASLELLLQAMPNTEKIRCVMIAEHHFLTS